MQLIIIIIFFASFFLSAFILIKKIHRSYSFVSKSTEGFGSKLGLLAEKERRLQEELREKEAAVQETIGLYEITKDIGKFLETDKIFDSFKSGLEKIIDIGECLYSETIGHHDNFVDFMVVPLSSGKSRFGYLAVKGLRREDKAKFEILVSQLISALKRAKLYKLVQHLSISDSLTKTFTHTYILGRLEEELKRSAQFGFILSCLMIDIDNFKSLNDTYGHLVGDAILKEVSQIIKLNCREIDLLGRFGGEEFIVALPMTPKENGVYAAERIRRSVAEKPIRVFDEAVRVTISIGMACFPEDAESCQELIDKADWSLYRSKKTGKNKVTAYAKFE